MLIKKGVRLCLTEKNIQIFKDTMDLIEGSDRLQELVQRSLENQRLYLEKDEVSVPVAPGRECKTVVFCGGHETQNYDAFCQVFGDNHL